jgi:glycosyltransferase involved in cell wall biosynthesis
MSAPSSIVSTRSGPSDPSAPLARDGKQTAHVVIPARNEAAAIGEVIAGCIAAGFAVTVIDDGSSDSTASIARSAGAEVVSNPGPHRGKTAALDLGLARLGHSVEWIFFLDGDGQHDPADLARFWATRHGHDLLVGNRFPDAARMPVLRRWTNRVMSALLRRSGIRDSQCGFRLVRRAWLGNWRPAGHHFQFETEMALLAAATGARVVNLPIAAVYAREESKIVPWRDALNFLRCLYRHYLDRPQLSTGG